MEDLQSIAFAKWIDFNYCQGVEYNSFSIDGMPDELTYTIEELFEMFKQLNN